jgi:hypothetical protein
VECSSPHRLNLSEKAFHGTVIPGRTFSSDTNYTFLQGHVLSFAPLQTQKVDGQTGVVFATELVGIRDASVF